MSKIELEQEVKLFSDEEHKAKQSVYIDLARELDIEPWINVIHNGEELSMSLDNWDKLTELVDKAKKELKIN